MPIAKTLSLRAHDEGDFVFVEKLSGFSTHAADIGRYGLAELLLEDLGKKMFVTHRLDKETSGALMFAASGEIATQINALFEKHQIQARYLMVTAQRRTDTEYEVVSQIEKKNSSFVSDPASVKPNSKTTFKKLKSLRFGDLWEATPHTDKPHQIRLHAADRGIPILGDPEHGGVPFDRLCLHSKSLSFKWKGKDVFFEAANPGWATDVEPHQALLLDAVQSRAALFDLSKASDECFRLTHDELNFCRIDQYGSHWWVHWYKEAPPTPSDLALFNVLSKTTHKAIVIRKMQDRGGDPNKNELVKIGPVKDRWEATENEVKFEFRTDSGLSAGLFLDQRENRRWVRQNAAGKKVLNLFSYTGAFSVNAALGGAEEVCTVDVSNNFNEWAVRNFQINGLDAHKNCYEFWTQDCQLFINGAVKRGRRWDMILCDPPSFGRSKEGTFQIHRNLPDILEACLKCLNPGGKLLLSSNYESWSLADLQKQVFVYRALFPIEVEMTPRQGLDFERPDTKPLMKSLIVVRR